MAWECLNAENQLDYPVEGQQSLEAKMKSEWSVEPATLLSWNETY
jgi:hypothetical protein